MITNQQIYQHHDSKIKKNLKFFVKKSKHIYFLLEYNKTFQLIVEKI